MGSYKDAQEAWLRRLQIYWSIPAPCINTYAGEIYEVDFGCNPGSEFSGRHLALCLSDTMPSQDRFLVIPITSKYQEYNIKEEDLINTPALNNDFTICGGVVLHEAKWLSKIRIFKTSKILHEDRDCKNIVKGKVSVSTKDLKRWREL